MQDVSKKTMLFGIDLFLRIQIQPENKLIVPKVENFLKIIND